MTTAEAIELIKAIEQSLEVLGEAMLIHNNTLQEMRTRIEAIEEQLDNAIKFSRS